MALHITIPITVHCKFFMFYCFMKKHLVSNAMKLDYLCLIAILFT